MKQCISIQSFVSFKNIFHFLISPSHDTEAMNRQQTPCITARIYPLLTSMSPQSLSSQPSSSHPPSWAGGGCLGSTGVLSVPTGVAAFSELGRCDSLAAMTIQGILVNNNIDPNPLFVCGPSMSTSQAPTTSQCVTNLTTHNCLQISRNSATPALCHLHCCH